MYFYPYPRPAVTVDAIIISDQNTVLLIRRGNEPYIGKWALPGGFIELDESLEDSCVREIEEETGLKAVNLKQFKAFGALNRDPRCRTISVVFYAFGKSTEPVRAGDDAAQVKWFPIDQLPELAFDHRQILDEFVREILNSH